MFVGVGVTGTPDVIGVRDGVTLGVGVTLAPESDEVTLGVIEGVFVGVAVTGTPESVNVALGVGVTGTPDNERVGVTGTPDNEDVRDGVILGVLDDVGVGAKYPEDVFVRVGVCV